MQPLPPTAAALRRLWHSDAPLTAVGGLGAWWAGPRAAAAFAATGRPSAEETS